MHKRTATLLFGMVLAIALLGGCGGTAAPASSSAGESDIPAVTMVSTPAEATAAGGAESSTASAVSTTAKTDAPPTETTVPSVTTAKKTAASVTSVTTAASVTAAASAAGTTTAAAPKSVRILSIGHSFSANVMDTYLWPMFEAGGYERIVLGYLYYPGCSLERHWEYVSTGSNEYERFSKNVYGRWSNTPHPTALEALTADDWDYVVLQPCSDYAGGPECCQNTYDEYAHLGALVDWVYQNATNPDVRVLYHLIWSYSKDCRLWSYQFHQYNQLQQYRDFVAATQKYVLTNPKVRGLIPAGTAIQNARTTYLRDSFNKPGSTGDGYHLNDKGDFVAALTWYCYFSGARAADATYCPEEYREAYPALAEAVDNALATPFAVTASSYSTYDSLR